MVTSLSEPLPVRVPRPSRKNYGGLILCSLLSSFNVFVTVSLLHPRLSFLKICLILFFELVLEFGLIFLYRKLKSLSQPIEVIFASVAIPLGILFAIIVPPGEAPDEKAHLLRAYGISSGNLIVESEGEYSGGSALPANLSAILTWLPEAGTYKKISSKLLDSPAEATFEEYNGSASYNPVCYIPQVIAFSFSKLLRFPLGIAIYFARLANLAAFIILIFLSIRIIPKFKSFIALFSLLPITLQQTASLSPDSLVIGFSVLLIAYTISLIYGPKTRLSPYQLATLYLFAALIGLLKIVYLPLLLLYILIPATRFGSKKQKIIHACLIAGITLITNASWLYISSRYLSVFPENVDSAAQLAYIVSAPHKYIYTLANTFNKNLVFYLHTLLGANLGALVISLPAFYPYLIFALCAVYFARNTERVTTKSSHRILYFSILCLIILLIFTALYLQWTPVGASLVEGVQGRYFLPILPLIPLFLGRFNTKKTALPLDEKYIFYINILYDTCALISIFAVNV